MRCGGEDALPGAERDWSDEEHVLVNQAEPGERPCRALATGQTEVATGSAWLRLKRPAANDVARRLRRHEELINSWHIYGRGALTCRSSASCGFAAVSQAYHPA
jgi:hypothetical protein